MEHAERVERLVIVGASLAGLRAAEAARKAGHTGRITMIGAEERLPYDRPPLSKKYLDAEAPAEIKPFKTETELRDDLGVDLLLGAPAEGLDTTAREVCVAGGGRIPYDALVIATGAAPRWFPGADGIAGVHSLRTADDARAVRAALDAGARTVVIGAGFIGSEVASAARKRGLPVTIVEALDVPLTRSVGREVGLRCADLHRAAGTGLVLGTGVAEIEHAAGRVTGVRLDTGAVLPADLVVLGIGVDPATGWLADGEVPLHVRDRGVVCDSTLWTGVPGVYAAGDVAHFVNPLFDDDLMRLEHWTNAAEQGAVAARHALDPRSAQPLEAVPFFWSDWYGHRIQFAGIPHADEIVVIDGTGTGGTGTGGLVAGGADGGFIALYRRDDRLIGALTVDRPRDIMKLRRQIAGRGSWTDALMFAGGGVAPVSA